MKVFQNFKVKGYFDWIEEKYKDYPFNLYCDYPVNKLDPNKINLFFAHEPNEIFKIHDWVLQTHKLFHGVISWDKRLLSNIDNGIEFHCSWRRNNSKEWEFLGDKKFEVSFLSGTKDLLEGHCLRHDIMTIKDKIKIPNNFYRVLEDWDSSTETRPGYSEYSKDLSHLPKEFYFNQVYMVKNIYMKIQCLI